ncbi:MAG: transposase family protein, partial [Methylovulum miyakonense]|uniref:transposase family protein n=1 Tax=Methylovulum miyakonense TaxID=645578 RepID=UPI003BB60833
MKTYAQLPTDNPEEFKRLVGLSKENFQHLNSKLCAYISEQKTLSPLTRRGRKDSKLAAEERLLLTLYYLRHYPTLINLGAVFGTCALRVSASRIAIKCIRVLPGSWPKLKGSPTARRCWKTLPPPWPLTCR